jgi:hypothetical protein
MGESSSYGLSGYRGLIGRGSQDRRDNIRFVKGVRFGSTR